MKIKLTALLISAKLFAIAQGVVGPSYVSDNGVEILMQDGFSSTSLDLVGSPRDLTKWTKSTESGTPGALSVITSASTWGQEYGYETGSTSYLKYVFGTAGSTNGVYIWSPSITLPNRTDLFARVSIRSNGSWTGSSGTLTFGMALDANNDQAADASPTLISTAITGGTPYNADYNTFFSSGSNYIRTIDFDLTTFANKTGRLGILIKGASMIVSETFQIDWFVVGTRPTNDLCSGALALGDITMGVNGGTNGYYNTTASGLTPSTTNSGIYEGGSVVYVGSGTNGTGSIPNSSGVKDGYEPTTGGQFGTSSLTSENTTWYKFTTPDVTACTAGTITAQLKITNLSCATNITKIPSQLQAELYSASVCGSTATSGLIVGFTSAGTAHAWNNNVTITTNSLAFNTTYYLLIDAVNANDCRYNIELTTLINSSPLTGCIVMPVELLNFTAKRFPAKVAIEWSTTSEVNNASFTIERSADAINFIPVKSVAGSGNSDRLINYSAIDENPINESTYYRLKQTDFNGKSSYSYILNVEAIDSKNSFILKTTNIFGQEVGQDYAGVKINFYSDGTIKKIISY